ncbi:MAG: YbfB/YjiJ family MFS transporter [Proteobacteria bacterium]|nr:YbfB/YjiJ family MFS transporter [Pseudomonadota bacterium]
MSKSSFRGFGVALGGLIAMAAAMGVGRFVYTPIMPFMEAALGLTKAEAGVLASMNFLGYLLGALAASASGVPGGRRLWFLGALAVSALSTGAMGISSSIEIFLGLRFVGGVASAFVLVFASALVLDRLAMAGRLGLSGLHFAGVGFGIAASAIIVSGLSMAGYGWQALWLFSGAFSFLALVAVALLIPNEEEPPTQVQATKGTTLDRRLVFLVIAYGLFGFGYVITATFISTMVRSAPDIQFLERVIWLVVGVAGIPSVMFWNWVGQRWGLARGFAIACLVEAVGVAMSVVGTSASVIVASAVLLGGTFMGISALGLVHARRLSSGDVRRSLALMTAAFGLGQMIGPTFAGYAYGFDNSFLAPSLTAVAALVIAAGLAIVPAPNRR